MDEQLNFKETGGEFGRVRRLPTFIISRNAAGMIVVRDEQNAKYLWQGKTLEQAEKAHEYMCDKRTMPHDMFVAKWHKQA